MASFDQFSNGQATRFSDGIQKPDLDNQIGLKHFNTRHVQYLDPLFKLKWLTKKSTITCWFVLLQVFTSLLNWFQERGILQHMATLPPRGAEPPKPQKSR